MFKVLLITGLLGCSLAVALAEPDGSTAPPAPLLKLSGAYKDDDLLPRSVSPDQTYGFIYPKRSVLEDADNPDAKLFLVTLKPFRVVAEIPTGGSYLNVGQGYFVANWAHDSSAVTVINGGKWGPEKVVLVPIRNGVTGKLVDLTAEVEKIVHPDFVAAKPEPFNPDFDFLFDSEDRVIINDQGELVGEKGWDINDKGQVVIDCTCTSNPKHDPDTKSWEGTFEGVWDIAQGKFVQQKYTRTFSGEYKEQ